MSFSILWMSGIVIASMEFVFVVIRSELALILAVLSAIASDFDNYSAAICFLRLLISAFKASISVTAPLVVTEFEEMRPEFALISAVIVSTEVLSSSSLASNCSLMSSFSSCKALNSLSIYVPKPLNSLIIIITV